MENKCLIVGTISSLDTLDNIINDNSIADEAQILEIRINKQMDLQELKNKLGLLTNNKPVPVRAGGWKILITIRTQKDKGSWEQDQERYNIFKDFFEYADYFDIEINSDLFTQFSRQDFPADKKIIVSYHNYKQTLSKSLLDKKISEAIKWGADIVKLALQANSQQDIKTLEKLVLSNQNLCIIGMGAKGKRSRYEFASLGSRLSYGYLDKPVALGQLSCKKLASYINKEKNKLPHT